MTGSPVCSQTEVEVRTRYKCTGWPRQSRTRIQEELRVLLEFCPTVGAEVAGRAGVAAVAPGVAVGAVAEVAGVGVLDDEVDEGRAAEVAGEGPGGGFIQGHERGLDGDGAVHSK